MHVKPGGRDAIQSHLIASRQREPAFVTSPRNRRALSKTRRHSSQRLTPPGGLPNYPGPASLTGITKLGENAPGKNGQCKRKRTSHHRAPQFVAGMTMMNAHLIACLAGVMVTNGDNRREKHVITHRHTLQGVVRLFIHVEESRLKPGQLEISRSAQHRAGVSKRTR